MIWYLHRKRKSLRRWLVDCFTLVERLDYILQSRDFVLFAFFTFFSWNLWEIFLSLGNLTLFVENWHRHPPQPPPPSLSSSLLPVFISICERSVRYTLSIGMLLFFSPICLPQALSVSEPRTCHKYVWRSTYGSCRCSSPRLGIQASGFPSVFFLIL